MFAKPNNSSGKSIQYVTLKTYQNASVTQAVNWWRYLTKKNAYSTNENREFNTFTWNSREK